MFVFALEIPVNDVVIKTFVVNSCNNPKIVYRELMSTDSCSERKEQNTLRKPVMINKLKETTLWDLPTSQLRNNTTYFKSINLCNN
jgi:hypothetical protein